MAGVELHKECLQPNSSALIRLFDQHTKTSVYYSITVNITVHYSRIVWYTTVKYGDYVRSCTTSR